MKYLSMILVSMFMLVFGFSVSAGAASTTISIKTPTYVFQSASFKAKVVDDIRPQKVKLLKSKGDWKYVQYKDIHKKTKKGYIAPNGVKKSFSKAFVAYDRPMMYNSKATKLAKGKYTITGETLTGWYVIKKGSKLYYTPTSKLKVSLVNNTVSYDQADINTVFGSVAKGTYSVVEEGPNGFVKIKVLGTPTWINNKKQVTSNESETFDKALDIVLQNFEGGSVEHPDDNGGKTNYGITQAVYKEYLKKKGLPTENADVFKITDEEVSEIYYERYFTHSKVNANRMSYKLATVMFDTAVNFGEGTADAIFQRAANIDKGAMNWGELTEYSFNSLLVSKEDELARRMITERIRSRYNIVAKDPKQKVFLKGWIARDEKLKKILGL